MCRKKGSDIYRQVADEKKWKEQFQTQSVTTIPPSLCSVHRVHFLAPSLSLLMSCLRAPAKTPLMRNIRRRGWNSGERSGGQLTDKRLNTTLTKQGKEGGRRKRQINKWIWYKLSSSSLAQWCCHCCGRDGWLPRKKKDPRRPTTHTPDLRCSPRNTGMHTLNMHTYLGQRHEMHPHASSQCTYSRTHTHTQMWFRCDPHVLSRQFETGKHKQTLGCLCVYQQPSLPAPSGSSHQAGSDALHTICPWQHSSTAAQTSTDQHRQGHILGLLIARVL